MPILKDGTGTAIRIVGSDIYIDLDMVDGSFTLAELNTALSDATLSEGASFTTLAELNTILTDATLTVPGIVSVTGNITLSQATHHGKTLRCTNSPVITIPTGLDTAFECSVINIGTGNVTFVKSGVTTNPDTLPELDNTGDNEVTVAYIQHGGGNDFDVVAATAEPVTLGFALSDETTDLTTGEALKFHMPYAVIVSDIRFTVNTAPTGAALQFDVNEGGTTVLSTKATIDVSETSTTTAATPLVISDNSWADGAVMTVDIDQVGSTIAGAGAKMWIYGYKA